MQFLTVKAPFSRYHEVAEVSEHSLKALHGVRPISPVGVGNWKNHLSRIAGQIKLHGSITKDLIEFGYEANESWIEILEGIEPDMSRSHFSEYFTKKEIHDMRRSRYWEAIKMVMHRIVLK